LDFFESYQTKHSLGLALIETYLEGGTTADYDEGIKLLEHERLSRGSSDSYPTATLLQLLTKILRKDKTNTDASQRAKECFNYGMKHFRNDDHFQMVAADYLKNGFA
jgi:hypothetical protein